MADELVGLVLNSNGLSLCPAGDAEYIEIAKVDEDEVVDAIIFGDDEVPGGIDVIRRMSISDLMDVFEHALNLSYIADGRDEAVGDDEFPVAIRRLQDTVKAALGVR